jgi:hypothetical protein
VCTCVLYYCHRLANQLQLTNISIIYHIISYHIISYHIISYHTIPYIISYHIIPYHISNTIHVAQLLPIIVTRKIVHDKLYLTAFRKKMSAVRCDYCQLFKIRASSFFSVPRQDEARGYRGGRSWFLKLLFEDSWPEMRSAVLIEFCWQFLCCSMAANIITQHFNTYLGQCMNYIH